MQVQVNTENGVENKDTLERWATDYLNESLARFRQDITRSRCSSPRKRQEGRRGQALHAGGTAAWPAPRWPPPTMHHPGRGLPRRDPAPDPPARPQLRQARPPSTATATPSARIRASSSKESDAQAVAQTGRAPAAYSQPVLGLRGRENPTGKHNTSWAGTRILIAPCVRAAVRHYCPTPSKEPEMK